MRFEAKTERLEFLLLCLLVGVVIAVLVVFRVRIRQCLFRQPASDTVDTHVQTEVPEVPAFRHDDIQALLASDIVGKFREACGVPNKGVICEKEWNLLFDGFRRYMPSFYNCIFSKQELSYTERKICLLVCLDFSSADIRDILDSTPQSVANLKRKASKKPFGDDSARTLSCNLQHLF